MFGFRKRALQESTPMNEFNQPVETVEEERLPVVVLTPEEQHAKWLAERPTYPQETKDLEESYKAKSRFYQRSQEALDSYVPTEPMFKIVEQNDGSYQIMRRNVNAARARWDEMYYHMSYFSSGNDYLPWADQIDAMNADPYVSYDSVKDYTQPIQRITGSYSRYSSPSIVFDGYRALRFNVFQDAEDYLKRMTQEEVKKEVAYDFPPLEKRDASLYLPERTERDSTTLS